MSDFDDYEGELLPPLMFADEAFAARNESKFKAYVAKVVVGYSKHDSFPKVFGLQYFGDAMMPKYINAIEANPFYEREFARVKGALKLGEVWTIPDAIHEMLSLVRSPFTKCTTRQKVIEQLNVLAGHTFIDSDGNTRAGRDLTDFYKNADALREKLPKSPGEILKESTAAAESDPTAGF
ncbi:hypothetical protein CPT_Maja_064 [Burkholderia phage Maja]|uniref:Uncharacterized protein n=1 Tax=Burkholderia phage Maja TaxID=2767571 RepID=A0A7S6R7F8_9CAUD|nr:hypothetical protein CPT_Maja_064 [Burkholderia phage Maja]